MEESALGILLVMLAAIFWGGSNTIARVGLQSVKVKIGTSFSLATAFIVALVIAVIFDFEALVSVSLVDVGWFALIGILHFGLGTFFLYQSMRYIGAARGTSVPHSYPLFALILAILFLGETTTILAIIGTVSIVVSLYLLLSEGRKTIITKKDRTLGYGFGLGTAFWWGAAAITIKHATQFGPPFVILTFALLSGLLVVLLSTAKDFGNGIKTNMKAISLLTIAGLLNGIALAFYYSSLAKAPVVLVSPLAATSPLFTILCVHLFLQRLERLTVQVVIACFLVVSGGVLVAIF